MVKCNKDQVERLKKALKREEDPASRAPQLTAPPSVAAEEPRRSRRYRR